MKSRINNHPSRLDRQRHSLLLLSLIIFGIDSCNGQQSSSFLSMEYAGTVTYSKQFSDVFSIAANQALLSRCENPVAGVSSERRFSIKELSSFRGLIAFPFLGGGAAAVADHAGYGAYNESNIGVAYGKALGEGLDLGLRFNYYLVHVPLYGNAASFNFEIGSVFHLTEAFCAGFHLKNPLGGTTLGESAEKLAAVYSAGLGYDISQKLFVGTQLQKQEDRPLRASVVMHYAFMKQFFTRAGIAVGPGNSFFGFGLQWKSVRLDIAGSFHPQLGFSPSCLVVFTLKKKEPSK